MAKPANNLVELEARIFTVRGQSVMLDADLAQLYGVETKALLQAMRRNRDRLPQDFVSHPTNQEVEILRSQIVTSKAADSRGGRRYTSYAFTEQGVAMLSSVLRSKTAVLVNITIRRSETWRRPYVSWLSPQRRRGLLAVCPRPRARIDE